jgi:hypothetical protein
MLSVGIILASLYVINLMSYVASLSNSDADFLWVNSNLVFLPFLAL